MGSGDLDITNRTVSVILLDELYSPNKNREKLPLNLSTFNVLLIMSILKIHTVF